MDQLAANDRGLTLGDGLFETILAQSGDLKRFARHLARLEAGCAVLGLPPVDRDLAERLARRALADAGLDHARAAVRLTLTAGSGGRGLDRPMDLAPRLLATAAPALRHDSPARLITATVRRNDRSPASRLKTLSYLDNVLARAEARAAGADEAVMLNTADEVACAAAANIFWVEGAELLTPALDCGVLDGVTRAAVLEAAPALGISVKEVRADIARVRAATAVFISNSLIGLRPVSSLDGRELPTWGGLSRLSATVL